MAHLHCVRPKKEQECDIILIFKSGDSRTPDDFRPITILDALVKLYHSTVHLMIRDTVTNFIQKQGVQYGRKGREMMEMIDKAQEHLDASPENYVLLEDIQKAFDSGSHLPPSWPHLLLTPD
jgi:hypothetical protein